MDLNELREEYGSQDNRATAYPIYVSVQEQVSIGVIADGYSVNCPYGDGEKRTKYTHSELEDTYDSVDDILECFDPDMEYSEEDLEIIKDDIRVIEIGYIWHPVEFFLTIKGAEQYMKSSAHRHGKLRIYVHHFDRRNFEMRDLLNHLEFKENDGNL